MTNDELRHAYAAGTPVAALEEQAGVTVGTIKNRLSKLGCTRRPAAGLSRLEQSRHWPASRALLTELARGPATVGALAEQTHYTEGTVEQVLYLLRRQGLTKRDGRVWTIRSGSTF